MFCTNNYEYILIKNNILFQSCIVGIVIPDVDVIKCWASENQIQGTLSVLCNHPEVKQLIFDDMISWGKEAGLRSFEQVILQTAKCYLNFLYIVFAYR